MNGKPAAGDAIVLVLGTDRLTAVCVPRAGRAEVLREILVHPGRDGESADPDVYAQAAVDAVASRPGPVVIGLPGPWISHAVFDMPALRGLDQIGYMLKETVRITGLPPDDILFAGLAPSGGRRQGGERMVVASRESPALEIVRRLAAEQRQVSAMSCGATTVLMAQVMEPGNAGASSGDARATVFLMRDGFEIVVHSGSHVHQLRLVTVAVPEETEGVAHVLIEEVRRSSIFYRERSRGGAIGALHVVGRFSGDRDQVRDMVSASTGIETTIDAECSATADVLLQAEALAGLSRSRAALNLLPVEHRRSLTRRSLAAVALLLAVLAPAGSFMGARFLRQKNRESADLLKTVSADQARVAKMRRDYDELAARVERFRRVKEELFAIQDSRLDVSQVFRDAAMAMGEVIHLGALEVENPIDQEPSISLQGAIHASRWDYDYHLSTFVQGFEEQTGLKLEIIKSDERGADDVYPFVLKAAWRGLREERS